MIRFNSFNYGNVFGYGFGNLSQLSSVRSSAYSRLLKARYGTNNSTAVQKNTAANKYNYSAYANSVLSNVSKESTELASAAKKLTDTGGLFSSQEQYDADTAYKAVSDFVSNYNETLDAVNKTTNAVVSSAAGSMARMAGIMAGGLGGIGITVARDGKMSVDEEEFKNAGFEKVKSLLGTNGSFARIIGSAAQRLGSAAEQQNRQTMANIGIYGIYGKNGSYFGNYGSLYGALGSGFNGWF